MTTQQQVIDDPQQKNNRFPFFPCPAPGETVYSLFSRAVERSGLPAKYLIEALTGQSRKTSLLTTIPGNMKRVSESVPYGHPWADINRMISNHTLFPYFSYFDTSEQRTAAWLTVKESNSCIKANMSLGITSYRQKLKSTHPRFCIDCLKEDQHEFGYTYFHREHQLPAVALCWKHGKKLFSGCQICNPFSGRVHGLTMAGRCQCSEGITPADSFCSLPESQPLLKWFADQSAYMVSSGGIACCNTRETLRNLYLHRGYCRGRSLLDYEKIANEIERRYGSSFLSWIGYLAWKNDAVSPWISRFLHERLADTRSPAIIYLLFIGVLFDSLQDFERSISLGGLNGVNDGEGNARHTYESNDENVEPLDTGNCICGDNLVSLLEEHEGQIATVAARLGVSSHTVTIEARMRGIRVPLPARTLSIHGREKLDEVRSSLRSGMPKLEIKKHYKVNDWTIILIELDEPGIGNAHRLAAAENVRKSHRGTVLEFIATNINASKSDLIQSHYGCYEFMLKNDKEWFDLQFSGRSKKRSKKLTRTCKQRPDSEVANIVLEIIEGMLAPNEKPLRITKLGVLKKAGYVSQFWNNRDRFPQTEQVLNQHVESKSKFLKRKIKWAMLEMCKSGQSISINRLRRVAGVPAQVLRERREYVISTATELGAVINGRSFFLDS